MTHQQPRGLAQGQQVFQVRCGHRGLQPPRARAANHLLSDF